MATCNSCIYFSVINNIGQVNSNMSIGECNYPSKLLPYSLRYIDNEKTVVLSTDGRTCVTYTRKKANVSRSTLTDSSNNIYGVCGNSGI